MIINKTLELTTKDNKNLENSNKKNNHVPQAMVPGTPQLPRAKKKMCKSEVWLTTNNSYSVPGNSILLTFLCHPAQPSQQMQARLDTPLLFNNSKC